MRRKSTVLMLGASLALAVCNTGVAGSESGSNVGETKAKPSESSQRLDNAATARRLAMYGHKSEDPLMLIAAARMMKHNPVREDEQLQGSVGSGEGAEGDGLEMTPKAVLARAKELAGDRQDLVALAKDVGAMSSRGAVMGAAAAVSGIGGDSIDRFEAVEFEGEEVAKVAIQGKGESDLDLFVFDENGNTICESESADDVEVCEWTPAWTGPFNIAVKNLGDSYNEYRILHN